MDDEHDQGVTTVQITAEGDLTNPNSNPGSLWINQ
jgi:hypothetical protein